MALDKLKLEAALGDFETKTLQKVLDEGIPQIEWRVSKLVPKRGITILGGTSGCYKTWTAMLMALSISQGKDFLHNFITEKANILYVDEENGDITIPNRFNFLIKGHNLENEFNNLHLSFFNNVKIDSEFVHNTKVPNKQLNKLKTFIDYYDIKVVVIDSMVRCMQGEEDKAASVRSVFENLKEIMKEYTELSFIILHHTTKGGKGLNSLRGSGDFAAFADVVLMFEGKGNIVNIEVAKNRHIDKFKFNRFSFQVFGSEDSMRLEYSDYKLANVSVIEDCKEAIIEYCKEKSLDEFSTGTLKDAMNKLGFKRQSFYDALKDLKDEHHIQAIKKGRYRVTYQEVLVEDVN
tara:strand:- start:185 stop:1231 length:1047 start_codon:yes stop_codon:yes gene_type:complete